MDIKYSHMIGTSIDRPKHSLVGRAGRLLSGIQLTWTIELCPDEDGVDAEGGEKEWGYSHKEVFTKCVEWEFNVNYFVQKEVVPVDGYILQKSKGMLGMFVLFYILIMFFLLLFLSKKLRAAIVFIQSSFISSLTFIQYTLRQTFIKS